MNGWHSWYCYWQRNDFIFSNTFRKHNIIVLSDEIYSRIRYDQKHVSLAKVRIWRQNIAKKYRNEKKLSRSKTIIMSHFQKWKKWGKNPPQNECVKYLRLKSFYEWELFSFSCNVALNLYCLSWGLKCDANRFFDTSNRLNFIMRAVNKLAIDTILICARMTLLAL